MTRRWQPEQLEIAVRNSHSIRGVIIELGLKPAGGNYTQLRKYIAEYQLDTSHFLGKGWNITGQYLKRDKQPMNQILVQESTYQSYKLKKRLFSEGYKVAMCEKCGWATQTSDGRLPLELHHINGDRHDNRLENLAILCPNCHSLEDNYRGRNIGKH